MDPEEGAEAVTNQEDDDCREKEAGGDIGGPVDSQLDP
jgi:hypothetical protein